MRRAHRPFLFTTIGTLSGAVLGTALYATAASPPNHPASDLHAAADPTPAVEASMRPTTDASSSASMADLAIASVNKRLMAPGDPIVEDLAALPDPTLIHRAVIRPVRGDRARALPLALSEEDHLVVFTAAYPHRSSQPHGTRHNEFSSGQIAGALITQPPAPPALSEPFDGGSTEAGLPLVESPDLEASSQNGYAAFAETVEPTLVKASVTVKSGDTLMGMFLRAGVSRADAHQAIEALRDEFDPRHIRPGHSFSLSLLAEDEETLGLETLRFEPSIGTVIAVEKNAEDGFQASRAESSRVTQLAHYKGVISSSLSEAGSDAGAPQGALAEMIRIFSFDVDFQRDIRKNDRFELFHEMIYTEDGRLIGVGDVIYASMTLSGTTKNLYRFTDPEGDTDYYNEKGEGVRKALLRTPINGARLSSGFGMRRHPVLGYSKMHRGLDFAAPRGTPIYAAGDGVVEKASRFGSYGHYIRLRHNSEFKTAYAHLKGYAKGIKAGARVKQGQVIGYVGSTGRSTGPHLHYEILRGGKQVNPMKVRFPSGKTLEGDMLTAFQQERQSIDVALSRTPAGGQLATKTVQLRTDETSLAD
ncbi:MAG: peptidoglycan DD-metalloendopeptidase family protein [Rhodospirillaceae bacterium]